MHSPHRVKPSLRDVKQNRSLRNKEGLLRAIEEKERTVCRKRTYEQCEKKLSNALHINFSCLFSRENPRLYGQATLWGSFINY